VTAPGDLFGVANRTPFTFRLEELTVHARLTWSTLAVALSASALAAQTPPPPIVTVSGVAYTQFQYQDAPVHVNNFDVTRAYVNVLGRLAGGISTRVTADIYRPAADNSLQYRLKYAFFAYTPQNSLLTYKLGQIHTPWLDWEEALWDYRMQGTVALDRNGYLSSSDFGVGVDGKWGPDRINIQIGLYNGENYNGGTGDFRKDVMGRASFRVSDTDDSSHVGGVRVTAYGQYGKPTGGGTRQRWVGMVSYRSKQITLAGEFAAIIDSVTAGARVPARVISGFGVYHLTGGKAALIGRVDVVDPNTNTANNQQTRIIGGASYQLSPNVRLLADLDRLSFESGAAARNQALLQAQFTF
jgi:hypothetical protein